MMWRCAKGSRKMPVRVEENAESSSSSTPPRKRSRFSPSSHILLQSDTIVHLPEEEECSTLSKQVALVDKATVAHKTKIRLSSPLKPEILQANTFSTHEKLLKRSMLNGYLAGDSHNKSSTDDSPCSEANSSSPVATLCNLGNTCFLNSVLYTLRFAPFFLHNLHHLVSDLNDLNIKNTMKTKSSSLGRNIGTSSKNWNSKDILSLNVPTNLDAHKSNVQVTTEELHELYESLHASEIKEDNEPFQAETYLQSLRMVNPIFEGNQQHDAHELLVCLLNNIRETCQLLVEQSKLQERDGLESAAAMGVKLDLAVLRPPPITTPISYAARWGVRKSWKKKKDRNAIIQSGTGNQMDQELDGAESLVNGLGSLKPLSLIAEDGPTSTSLPESSPRHLEANSRSGTTKLHNFIADDFEGMSILSTKCLECEHTTMRKEAFCDICVPITIERKDDEDSDGECGPKTVSGMYQSAIVTSEHLRDLNKYWCEQCLRLNEARRWVRYETLPKLLVLQLKRFSSTFNSIVSVSKINDYMPTPLTLACFCEKCSNLPEEKRPHQYKLYGIIMHLGATIASGHYVAYVKASDNSSNYCHCDRDKRKASSLSASGGKGGNSCDKVGGFFKFFRQKSNASSDNPSTKPTNTSYYANICRSLDCCGIKLNRSFMEGHHGLNGDSVNGTSDRKEPKVDGCVNGLNNTSEAAVPEPVWLECDDENVRPLSLKEFEEVLAPKTNRRSSQTPYLLFYSKCH